MRYIRNSWLAAALVVVSCLAASSAASAATDRSDAAQAGWVTNADGSAGWPPADFRGGDQPADHPGASRANTAEPATIEVVRPERTIVRDVDELLPLLLSGAALMLVLAGFGVVLVRGRVRPS